jgi:spore germination protein YaaH
MRHLAGACLFLALAGCGQPEPRFTVVGYHPWWMGDAWEELDMDVLDEVLFFDLWVAADGTIAESNGWPGAWQGLIDAAAASGTPLAPTLSFFDAGAFTRLFESEAARDTLLAHTVRAVRGAGAGGVHIDFELFEDVSSDARAAFPEWVARVKRALGHESIVSVYTLAMDDRDRYDEVAIARVADYLVVQGYDFTWLESRRAGPTAAVRGPERLTWESVLARYDSLGVPREKLLMATPLFGYEWPTEHGEIGARTTGEGRITSFAPVADRLPERGESASELARTHGLRRDPETGSPFYAFETDDGWRQGWFDDEESLREKFEFVRQHGLGGVALFPLGYDGGRFDGVIREAFPDSLRARRQ